MKATATVRPSRYTVYRRNTYTRYPNAATRRRFWDWLLDVALTAAVAAAIVVIMMFIVILA